MARFTHYTQHDSMDCGPTCLRMISKYYGRNYSLEFLRNISFISREGVSLLSISEAAEKIGFKTIGVKIDLETLIEDAPLPAVLHWNQNHFVVLYKITKKLFSKEYLYHIADPGGDRIILDKESLTRSWIPNGETNGIALLLEPTPEFYTDETADKSEQKGGFKFLFKYINPYKKFIIQLLIGMTVGLILELIVPFLSQSMIDDGVNNSNIHFIYIILLSQLMIFSGTITIEIIRSWLLLHVSTRINISIISDFISKLMKLPISFFDIKMMGDITQRINDHHRIEQFLTGVSLNTFFSFLNLIVFSIVLATYNIPILLIFFIGSIITIVWILFFMEQRKNLDYKHFNRMSENQDIIFEMISGMQEIKLNNCETQKRWKWEHSQAQLFKLNVSSLSLEQWQMNGHNFINELKNIIISFLAAKAVIDGNMTLGMMMATSYIVGQMNGPLSQFIGFFRSAQDASISLDRLNEIHQKENEETEIIDEQSIQSKADISNYKGSLVMDNLTFHYEGPNSPKVLDGINLNIPNGKITAIVGASGSGKTTILKLLLKFYKPNSGDIYVGNINFDNVHSGAWRSKCGTVMQDGFIFNDSIAKNIALGIDKINFDKLQNAVYVANIKDYIDELPLGFNTKLGAVGSGISQGQKQRMLIARAVYKNPDYLFFDEATSALDANNESVIMKNLDDFFVGKTVVVVAHRLSTVKNAHQIVVLDKGKIVELGNHEELTAKRGAYYNLVKNQLELGN